VRLTDVEQGTVQMRDPGTPAWETAESLFASSWTSLVRLAAFLTGSVTAGEDVVQEILLRLGSGRYEYDEPEKYVRTSIVNAARSYNRRRMLERKSLRAFVQHSDSQPGDLWDALRRLTSRQRIAVVLRYYEGFADEEIAIALRCRPSTVRSLIHRAIEKMRGELIE